MNWNARDIEDGKSLTVPQDVYKKGCTADVDEGLESAKQIGFPVMIKASEGGGGKGIRKSNNAGDFPNLYRQVNDQQLENLVLTFVML